MDLFTILLIAFGLSMDAFAVSITNGVTLQEVHIKDALKIAGYFGIFQALMPLLGWLVGINFQNYITKFDHWIAFLLLAFIGGKMIYETLKSDDDCQTEKAELCNKTLFILAIATSIDALAVGVSFAFFEVSIIQSILIIGIVTFIICFMGVYLGKKFGCLLKKNAELIGGIVLMMIGFKIFAEHTNLISAFNIFN
ncbi:manganese efflux pump MntP family protein [uncultured Clostridium sp.]|uniref:manganese efflux pump MntP n=1 Tax=uncultured Clostridium sp. TaxID=59620 RepID=UPI0028E58B64|nr:manganese efflux pump MntP family protein [uncultured Clostridium sp.]